MQIVYARKKGMMTARYFVRCLQERMRQMPQEIQHLEMQQAKRRLRVPDRIGRSTRTEKRETTLW
jgi:hypothetical protein